MFKLNLIVITVVLLLVGCGSPTKVTRIDENATTDLSGDWNDTDARLTAEEMVRDALSKPWREDFTGKKGTKPTVIVGKVTNRSLEHIDVQTFVRQLERSLLNSGTVSFVAGGQERKQVREEIKDQAKNASDETMKGPGQETGADFMLTGNISSIVDQEGVAIRPGHHCTQPVMDFFGIAATARASVALYNTREDIDALVAAVRRVRSVFA